MFLVVESLRWLANSAAVNMRPDVVDSGNTRETTLGVIHGEGRPRPIPPSQSGEGRHFPTVLFLPQVSLQDATRWRADRHGSGDYFGAIPDGENGETTVGNLVGTLGATRLKVCPWLAHSSPPT